MADFVSYSCWITGTTAKRKFEGFDHVDSFILKMPAIRFLQSRVEHLTVPLVQAVPPLVKLPISGRRMGERIRPPPPSLCPPPHPHSSL